MKTLNVMQNVGKAKYLINYHDGISTNRDGSPFYGVRICSSKKKLAIQLKGFKDQGYRNESNFPDDIIVLEKPVKK